MEYANIRKTGLLAITLKENDELIEVKFTDNDQDVFLVTKNGQCIRFHETDVRSRGRTAMGVRGINLDGDDEVIGMQLNSQGEALLFVSENGMGKRTAMTEFTPQHRGGKGIRCYKITEKTGDVVGVKAVDEENEVMMITTEGVVNLDDNVIVASLAKVRDEEVEQESETSEEETE